MLNRPIQVKDLFIALLLGTVILVGLSAADPPPTTPTLEYKVVDETFPPNTLEPRLNQLADEGWRVISLSSSPGTPLGGASYLIVFERAKQNTP